MSSPQVSVVVPCYNARRYIGATLDSVLAQQGFEIEIIVVDDGSSDGSAQAVRSAYPQVRVIEQANQGVASARNLGIASASHPWIAFVDADDIWLPGKLMQQWQMLAAEPAARMAYSAWHVWHTQDVLPAPALLADLAATAGDASRWAGPSGWIYPDLLLDCVVWTSTVVVHRSVLDEVGTFPSDLRVGEDYDLWLRASRVTPILRVCEPLALYRIHAASITRRPPAANYKGNVIRSAVQRWGYVSPDGRSTSPAAVARSIARSWLDYGSACLIAGNGREARTGAWKAISHQAFQWSAWALLAKSLKPQRRIP